MLTENVSLAWSGRFAGLSIQMRGTTFLAARRRRCMASLLKWR
jgi:hypothetical protein